jgi:biofilm PGA synthesis N-glycosyltransferase PgaC
MCWYNMAYEISIGIPAFNEESNIAGLLNAIVTQKMGRFAIDEIIVVSSGSTDKTDAIVEAFSDRDSRIRLIRQVKREGKASAINEFIKTAHNKILVLESADTIPDNNTIEKLCLPFENSRVGMTGARPIPVNDSNRFMGYVSHLLWSLHNRLAVKSPKCGELVAFRKVFRGLPKDTAVDEAWIEYEIRKRNYRIVYVSEATVLNKGPDTISDFLRQRRRIAFGHLDLSKRTQFEVSTSNFLSIFSAILAEFPFKEPKKWLFLTCAFTLEGLGRFLGYYDYHKKKHHSVWEISKTTKSLGIQVSH